MIRVLVRCLVALVLIGASVVIGWRVLGPAEVLASATEPYPAKPIHPRPGYTARLLQAPLVVQGRIRVIASEREVRADTHVGSRAIWTPDWSLRRWPQQVAGIVSVGQNVITRWSDGKLIAIDGATGKIVWRAADVAGAKYTGYNSGAATVWTPPGLHTAAGSVLVGSGTTFSAYDGGSGVRRWSITVPAGCATSGFTTSGGQLVCPTGAYDAYTGLALTSWPAGPYTPLDCQVAASGCNALRDGSGHGWLADKRKPVRSKPLDRPGSTIADGVVLYSDGGRLRTAGSPYNYPDGRVLGTSWGKIVILRKGNTLSELNPHTGRVTASVPLNWISKDDGNESANFTFGNYQLVDGIILLERVRKNGPANPGATGYYFSLYPIMTSTL